MGSFRNFLDGKDVLGLDVSVDDAFFVGGVERGADLASDLDDFGKRQLAHPTEPLVQVFAFEQLHDDKRRAVFVLVKVGDLDDVGVAQSRHSARFVLEALVDFGVGGGFPVQDFDRENSAGSDVTRCIHGAHAASAEHSLDVIGSAQRSSQKLGTRLGLRSQRSLPTDEGRQIDPRYHYKAAGRLSESADVGSGARLLKLKVCFWRSLQS